MELMTHVFQNDSWSSIPIIGELVLSINPVVCPQNPYNRYWRTSIANGPRLMWQCVENRKQTIHAVLVDSLCVVRIIFAPVGM